MAHTLIRSKRKTVAIHIKDGKTEVRAPLSMPKREIDAFVTSKEKWIETHLQQSRDKMNRREEFELNYGDGILYRGESYIITALEGKRAGFKDGRFYLPPGLSPIQIKNVCVQIYRRLAKIYLEKRVAAFAAALHPQPARIKINGATTRWGSCSAKKNLNFSWRLMMAGDETIDYVVVHELSHLIELNHSPKFWNIIAAVLPDYKEREAKLKILQQKLSEENWESS